LSKVQVAPATTDLLIDAQLASLVDTALSASCASCGSEEPATLSTGLLLLSAAPQSVPVSLRGLHRLQPGLVDRDDGDDLELVEERCVG
jgi:hypothetical protein